MFDSYHTDRIDDYYAILNVDLMKAACTKDVWPWIFTNRIVGYKKSGIGMPSGDKEHFQAIKGMDLYDEMGALTDFKTMWRVALKLARELQSPGIFLDPEPYNNYKYYSVSLLAKEMGKPAAVIREKLKELGRQLADTADEVYPGVTIWCTFTGMGSYYTTLVPFPERDYRTITYIIIGMLERAKENKSNLRVISGGMLSLGYCSRSWEHLADKIRARENRFSEARAKFPNLFLAGTIAPWSSPAKRGDWMLGHDCAVTNVKHAKDFVPFIVQIFNAYRYAWIYGAVAAPYNPYDPAQSGVYDSIITRSVSSYCLSESNSSR